MAIILSSVIRQLNPRKRLGEHMHGILLQGLKIA